MQVHISLRIDLQCTSYKKPCVQSFNSQGQERGGNPRIPEDHHAARLHEDSMSIPYFFLYNLSWLRSQFRLLKSMVLYCLSLDYKYTSDLEYCEGISGTFYIPFLYLNCEY